MAHTAGSGGQVQAPGAIAGIKSWSLDYTVDTLDTTDFADAGVKTYIMGCSGWSGSFEGYKDGAPIGLAGASITLTLYEVAAGTNWTGTAFITGVNHSVSHDGIVSYAYDFQGTAGLTVAQS